MTEKRILAKGAVRLDRLLVEELPGHTRSFYKNLIDRGLVQVNGKTASAGAKPAEGSEIVVTIPEPETLDVQPEDIPLDIVYEDEDILVVNKAKGMVVHPAPGNYSGTLVSALLYHAKNLSGINGVLRPGIVHRLDKDTTGLLVVAKNDAAHLSLAKQIQEKTAVREYLALCYGGWREEEGEIDAPIGRSQSDRKRMSVRLDGRRAVTHYQIVKRYEGYTLVEARLETGRTHQIRVHFAHAGHPVVGDEVYCKRKPPFETQGQMLHAFRLSLDHPTSGKRMTFEAPLPAYFQNILSRIREK